MPSLTCHIILEIQNSSVVSGGTKGKKILHMRAGVWGEEKLAGAGAAQGWLQDVPTSIDAHCPVENVPL